MLFKALGFELLAVANEDRTALPLRTVVCGSQQYSVDAVEHAVNAGAQDLGSINIPGD